MIPLNSYEIHGGGDVISHQSFPVPMSIELAVVDAPRPGKKRVRFHQRLEFEIINKEIECMTAEDVDERWWRPEELSILREEAKDMSAIIRRSTSSRDCSLIMAHRKTTLMLNGEFKALLKLPGGSPDQDLTKWCYAEDGRRGLERFSSRDYACFRRRDIVNTRSAVLVEQSRQRQGKPYNVETIASAAREASCRSRTFALYFGGADARIAKVSHQEQDAPIRRAPPRKRSKICHQAERCLAA